MKVLNAETTNKLEMITEQLQDTNNLMRALINYLDSSNDRITFYTGNRGKSNDGGAMLIVGEINEAPIRVTLAYDAIQKLQDQIKKLKNLSNSQVTAKGEQNVNH